MPKPAFIDGKFAHHIAVTGGIGCIAGDTPIYDPVDGTRTLISERWASGQPFHVLSTDGKDIFPVLAYPPVKEGPDGIFKVRMSNGQSIGVTENHLFLTVEGWVTVASLLKRPRASWPRLLESLPALPASTSGTGLSGRGQGERRLTETPPGFPVDCLPGSHFDDARPLDAADDDPASVQQLDDALVLDRNGSHPDAPVDIRAHNHVCPESALRAKTDSQPRDTSQPLSGHTQIDEELTQLGYLLTPFFQRLPAEINPSSTTDGLLHISQESIVDDLAMSRYPIDDSISIQKKGLPQVLRQPQFGLYRPPAFSSLRSSPIPDEPSRSSSFLDATNHLVRILCIERQSTGFFYDFHVPGTNTYAAAGVWNHNSGKSTVCKLLGEHLPAEVFEEPFRHNQFLTRFYDSPAEWAGRTQLDFLGLRYALYMQASYYVPGKPFSVSDSIPQSDVIFAVMLHEAGLLPEDEFLSYQRIFRGMMHTLPPPHLIIGLETPVEQRFERVVKRARDIERTTKVGVTPEYLESQEPYLDRWWTAMAQFTRVVRLPWTDGMDKSSYDVDRIVDLAASVKTSSQDIFDFMLSKRNHPGRTKG